MGDSVCLMHDFSCASAIPNQSEQGNPVRVLGESVTFGRFMSESEPLSWDKWSTFSHKKYVEEAARYAKPGSVAQKKAFFEAHYKKIAAQKAAAAAAALLEQENAARAEAERALENSAYDNKQVVILNSAVNFFSNHDDDNGNSSVGVITGNEGSEQRISVSLSENVDIASCSEGNGTPQMERPLLKENCVGSEDILSTMSKKKSSVSSLKSSVRGKTWKAPSTPMKPVTPHFKKENNVSQFAKKSSVESLDKKRRPFPKSLRGLISSIPIKEPDKAPVFVSKKASSSGLTPSFSTTLKDCRTPLRTPFLAAVKGVAKYSASTPLSENKRIKTPTDSYDLGSKTAGPKWHTLSTVYTKSLTACRSKLQSPATSCRNRLQSPASSTPFTLRTEERAAKRKQKLEEKFNEQKVQLQKERAGNEIKKLSYGFCFKARPLPDFYKEREAAINQMKKTPTTPSQTVVLGRSNSKKQHGTVTMPPPQSFTRNPLKKNAVNPNRLLNVAVPQRITHENKSPNIQH